MQTRKLGRTGLDVSLLTFGCGAVGGLMTKGDANDQDRAVAWAVEHGINHFDTAPLYGNGASESNLGRALKSIDRDVIVSTKVRIVGEDLKDIEGAIRRSIETSLTRLDRDHVDLFQLHNLVGPFAHNEALVTESILEDIVPIFEKLRDEGKTRYLGFTANGDTDALHQLITSQKFDAAQIFYNILTPSAGEAMPRDYPGQDFRQLLVQAAEQNVGSIGVRVLAGGALSGQEARHPLGMPSVAPIGSGHDYATDVARARRFGSLIDNNHVGSLPELAIRYAISNAQLSTTEIGIATIYELRQAANAVNLGPLSTAAMREIKAVRDGFVGELR